MPLTPYLGHLRRFILRRKGKDVSGVSGRGVVAAGVQLLDGSVAFQWVSPHETVLQPRGIDAVLQVHGHGGATVVEWLDPPPDPAPAPESQPDGRHPV